MDTRQLAELLCTNEQIVRVPGPHRSRFGDQTSLVSILEPDPDFVGCGKHQVAELI
jgi:hypothetical protein